MPRANTVLLNVSGGEISPEMYGRLDLPTYQRGNQRIQNYFVLAQGGAQYRNALKHVHNTRGLNTGRLISFSFSEADTYVIEFTNQKLRFYRNFGAILNDASATISAITKANPGVITATSHGFSNDQEIFITGVKGMVELNDQFFIVKNVTTHTFQVANVYGTIINSSQFNAYISGGTARTVYEIDSPYEIAHIPELHYKQSADTIEITHQKYAPYKLTRTGHTAWTISTFTRTADPFGQKAITGATQANPGVITATGHGLAVGDEVWIDSIVGMVELNKTRHFVNSTPTADTFTLKNAAGTPINTTGFTAYSSGGIVIKTDNCPKTVAFLDSARKAYGNTKAKPATLFISRSPDSSTGATRFDDFTAGSDATHAILYTLSTVFDKLDAIQWISQTNKNTVVGCVSSVRRLHGDTVDDVITPASIRATPITNVGAASVQPFSSGQSMYYVDGLGNKIESFIFAIQSNDFVPVNQNLTSAHLGSSNFIEIAQQRGDSGLLWVLRADGVLLGMTFNELESIFGWHRHYVGGDSVINSVNQDRAKVLSIAVEPRAGQESVLWAMVERKVGANTYRSVEYLTAPIRFVEVEDFFSGSGFTNQAADAAKYNSAVSEQLKDSIHVDSAVSYDGSLPGTGLTMTPSATSGDSVQLTASGAFFTSDMIGKQIWKKYDVRGNGGGRAEITGVSSTTVAFAKVLSNFDVTTAIPSGSWFITTKKVFGLMHLAGETVHLQLDGAPSESAVVGSDGSVVLPDHASKAHLGYKYDGLLMTLNLDVAGERGSAQAKIRKIVEILPRFHNTVGAKVGTTPWNAESLTFKTVDDLTDRPTPLFRGILEHRPSDSHTRQTKQACVIQDIPSPQTLLSLDIMVSTADD